VTTVRLRARDVLALLLLVAVLVPYVGYLVNGEMPLIGNSSAMASTGLLLGVLAFWVIRGDRRPARLGRVEAGSAGLAVVLYVLTIALSETSAVELLLAAFICSLMLLFALDLLDRGGTRPDTTPHR
jgi:peptidoglycan/LPS O-acetylase OafA/YrhL